MFWLYVLLEAMNRSHWKILLLCYIENYCWDKVLYLKRYGLESVSDKLNPFLRDIHLNLSELFPQKDDEENSIIKILSHPIWLEFNIKRSGNFIFFSYWRILLNGVFCINDNRHDITEILLKVALNTTNQTKPLLMIIYLKIKSVCHTRNSKTNIWLVQTI
jgi:hypothetical protein